MISSKNILFSVTAALMLGGSGAYAQNMPVQVVTNQQFIPIASASGSSAKPLERIPEKKILWKKRVWRIVDGNDEKNRDIFIGSDADHTNVLADMLMDGITKGEIKAYSNTTETFTTVLSAKEVAAFTLVSTYKFRVKEDWLFVSSNNDGSGHMEVRIVGIAPITEVANADGTKSEQAAYWIYYPDSRNFLHQGKAVKERNATSSYTWDQYFEGGHFASKIDRVVETSYELPK